jgi:hypothetical protein
MLLAQIPPQTSAALALHAMLQSVALPYLP